MKIASAFNFKQFLESRAKPACETKPYRIGGLVVSDRVFYKDFNIVTSDTIIWLQS